MNILKVKVIFLNSLPKNIFCTVCLNGCDFKFSHTVWLSCVVNNNLAKINKERDKHYN